MKRNILWLSTLVLTIAAGGCSGGTKEKTNAECDSVYVGVAEVGQMFRDGETAEKYMAAQAHLVDMMREGKAKDSPVDILSQSGYFFIRQGDYLNAMEYLHEASDSLSKENDAATLRGKISLPGNLSNMFFQFGLYEDALLQNAKAIAISNANGNIALSDLSRMRGAIYGGIYEDGAEREFADSALAYYNKAIVVANTKEARDLAEVIRAEFMVNHQEIAPDSILSAIATLRRIANECGADAATASAVLGQALVGKGEYSEGLTRMEWAISEFKRRQDKESEEWALGLLADGCVEAGRYDKLQKIYPQYTAIRDSIAKSEKTNAVIGAEWRYRVKEKSLELVRAQQQQEIARKTIYLQRIILALAIIVIALIIYLAYRNIKRERLEKVNAREQIKRILEHQQSLNQRIEGLNAELAAARSKTTIETVAMELSPSLLLDGDEKTFRKAFATLHPNFLRDMRRDYPQITANDELVLMLMRLHFSTDEIAMSLGIGRQSVLSIRHRIRKKMNLDKSRDLDQFILSRS